MLRPTVRARFTLLYGSACLGVGVCLLTLVYLLMRYWPDYRIPDKADTLVSFRHAPAAGAGPCGVNTPTDCGTLTSRPDASPTGLVIHSKADVLTTLLQFSGLALLLLTVLAFGLGWIIAGRILAPVHRITDTARTLAARDLGQRIGLDGPDDEFKELADTFDAMLERLDTAFAAQQRFAANASHELRTPLTATRTMLQVALAGPDDCDIRDLAPKLLAINRRSTEATNALLALARDPTTIDRRTVDLARLAREALHTVRDEAHEKNITLSCALQPVHVTGDPALLLQLLTNLLTNALRHNHTGGTATLSLTAAQDPPTALITTANTGDPVPPGAVPTLFEPFHRLTPRTRSGGHGLGLPLIRSVARAHNGTATATANPTGGLTLHITLPASPATG
ncbi:HAMP domain-containing sensor histidine kinase [Streptomyces sp. WAC06614]|uniref:sensor histidine kinase n=1 Tax=Streptomyces sp. WAC06614 TaxID=2487416 RepID=UPI00163BC7A7|nr:HAMP domain-containing sensor histidine kinase [Streptomyces sp. WAC06614]